MLGTFITITSGDITDIIGYLENFLTDLVPLLKMVVVVGLGIFIFWAIVSAIKK